MDPLRTFLCAIEDFRQFGLKGFLTAEFCRIPATGSAWLCAPSRLLFSGAVGSCGGGRSDSCARQSILVPL